MQSGYARLKFKSSSDADNNVEINAPHELGDAVNVDEEEKRPVPPTRLDYDHDSLWDDVDSSDALSSPRDHDVYSIIDVLSSQLQNREIPQYLDEFEVVIPDVEVVVGAVPVEEVQQREQQVEEAKLRQAELESTLYRQREMHLAQQEAVARERLLQEARQRHAALVLKDRQAAEAMQLRARRIGHVFQQAETHLKDALKKQEAQVQQIYGALTASRVPQSRKRYRVEWARIPLTIRIRAKTLCAVKDKLPGGQYVMVATLYDHLGGHALHWTNWDPEVAPRGPSTNDTSSTRTQVGRPNFTRPFHHRGRFYNTEVAVNQDLFVVCPPEVELRPGNTLVFELFMLSQATTAAYAGSNMNFMPRRRRRRGGQLIDQTTAMQIDHVVAWGALPLSTPEFQVVQGKFKVPLLRGEMDPTMDKYQDMEHTYQNDLSSWLCNFYFQIQHLAKPPAVLLHRTAQNRQANDDPFDAEIDERGGLVRLMLPEIENNHQRYMRKMSTVPSSNAPTVRKRSQSPVHLRSEGELGRDEALHEEEYDHAEVTNAKEGGKSGGAVVKPYSSASTLLVDDEDGILSRSKKRKTRPSTRLLSPSRWRWKRWFTSFGSTKSSRVYSGDPTAMQVGRGLVRTAALLEEGNQETMLTDQLSSRQLGFHSSTMSDQFDSIDENDEEQEEDTEDVSNEKHRQLDVENYAYSVNSAASVETARHQRFHAQRKIHYMRHELLVDLGFSNWHTLEFWRLTAMLLFACWIRLYVHYLTQWLFLRGSRVPVYDFQPRWTTCIVKYTWQTIATRTEIGVLAVGVLGNAIMFAFLSSAAAVGQRFVGDLPAFASNFIVCAGIATVLDPFLVLTVDMLSHHYGCSQLTECALSLTASGCSCVDGDWFKLYVRFQAQEGSGLVGVFIVLILYVALTCMSLVGFYVYLLYIHMNGRMLDVYRRVHGHEHSFFVPHDAEISLQELQTICAQATRWKGPRGTQRKVFVHEYSLSDPLDPLFRETNTHIAIYNVELDGTRELHRHFLKMPDGAVLELFGELGANTDGNWKSDAPQGAASLALLYNILQDVQRDDKTLSPTAGGLF